MQRAVRNLGREGLAATAISAVDAALYDLKARLLEMPLADAAWAVIAIPFRSMEAAASPAIRTRNFATNSGLGRARRLHASSR